MHLLHVLVTAARSKHLVTAYFAVRDSKIIPSIKDDVVKDALTQLDCYDLVDTVMVYERFFDTYTDSNGINGDDSWNDIPPLSYEMKV